MESSIPELVGPAERPAFDAQGFFEAIPSDRERALAMLRREVPPDGPPTPRVQVYISNGEWDSNSRLVVRYVPAGACCGRVGLPGGDAARFCGVSIYVLPDHT